MKHLRHIVLALLTILVTQCSRGETTHQRNVVVSIVPLQEFVEKVGGDKVNVAVMVPPGASPHAYEPNPAQLIAVSNAHMYVKVGTPIEFEIAWLDKVLSMNSTLVVCNASEGITLIAGSQDDGYEQNTVDPHVWLSPQNAKMMVDNIYNTLCAVDSINKQYYRARRDKYCAELDSLHRRIEQMLSDKKRRQFIVYHASWRYFARDYGLQQIPIQTDGKEPTAQDMRDVIRIAREHNIKTIFVSPQFSTKSADVIAHEIGGTVRTLDPLAKDYVANMEKVARSLSAAME
jgi:zinc transport system substrate-binding protein